MAERKQIFAETRYSVHCSSDHFLFRSLAKPRSQAQFGFRTPMIRNTKQSTLTIAKTLYKCILTTIDDDIHLLISSTESSRKDHFGWNCSENTVVGSFLCLLRVNGEDLKQVQKHRKAEAKVPRFNISRVFWLLSHIDRLVITAQWLQPWLPSSLRRMPETNNTLNENKLTNDVYCMHTFSWLHQTSHKHQCKAAGYKLFVCMPLWSHVCHDNILNRLHIFHATHDAFKITPIQV